MAGEGDTWGQLTIDPSVQAIEMKITARVEDEDEVIAAVEWADEPELREVFFFDTADLTLFEAGIVLRARLVHGGTDDSTVKLRPVEPTTLSRDWLTNPDLEIEVDTVGKDFVYSAKLSAAQDRGEIHQVASGTRELRKLFSADQDRFLDDHAPVAIPWDDLAVLGPVEVRKWEVEPKGLPYGIDVEEWVLPDRSDLVELSIKVEPSEGVDANSRFVEFLRERGIDTEGDQKTKTRTALEYFTNALRG